MVIHTTKKLLKKTHDVMFGAVHGGRLIYNTSWEDPRIDRELMQLDGESKVVMITSAGCNALDYLLDSPAEIHSVDVNYRQNALTHLKLSLIRRGVWEDLYALFGNGQDAESKGIYLTVREDLPEFAQQFWDRKIRYFRDNSLKRSFYYHGTSGEAAWILGKLMMTLKRPIRQRIDRFFDSDTLDEQQEIYREIEPVLWDAVLCWLLKQPALMAMMGVPRPQIRLIDESYPGGLLGYIQDKFRHVMTRVRIDDNYFWRVYITGSYTTECCPNYLRKENLPLLQANADRVHLYTTTVTDFLKENPGKYTHFVLLDHQDWLAGHAPEALAEEWEEIFANSAPGATILMRSAGITNDFLPPEVRSRLRFRPDLTEPLHATDRVGTYGSLHFAEIL
jgi:S-adenosylmethionine-diacylglycerol 3-amino-3-carboxypropyl transferase